MPAFNYEEFPINKLKSDQVVHLARTLIGCVLATRTASGFCAGIITETEAYAGITDRASHAYGGRKTERTRVMYEEAGRVYVYLCYGLHYLFNIVTAEEGNPHAILIRGIYPIEGLEIMENRRKMKFNLKNFSYGPATVSQAFGINKTQNNGLLNQSEIFLFNPVAAIPKNEISDSPRIGVDYAKEDALLPWRFNADLNRLHNRYISGK
ncbi:MAG: DNA-3-methyladenine glycosylase [Bacteroidia bacterium]